MSNKLFSVLLVLVVFLSGCVGQPAAQPTAADTTEKSISEAGSVDSDLTDTDTKDVSSDLDQAINTLS